MGNKTIGFLVLMTFFFNLLVVPMAEAGLFSSNEDMQKTLNKVNTDTPLVVKVGMMVALGVLFAAAGVAIAPIAVIEGISVAAIYLGFGGASLLSFFGAYKIYDNTKKGVGDFANNIGAPGVSNEVIAAKAYAKKVYFEYAAVRERNGSQEEIDRAWAKVVEAGAAVQAAEERAGKPRPQSGPTGDGSEKIPWSHIKVMPLSQAYQEYNALLQNGLSTQDQLDHALANVRAAEARERDAAVKASASQIILDKSPDQ